MALLERFLAHLASLKLGRGRALIAVSGGVDSVVLLDLLCQSRDRHGLELVVAHADHGIHPDSAAVAAQVEALGRGAGLEVIVGRLSLAPGASETRARAARYRWLREARRQTRARWIFTAHQADDQHETVLMRFLRGSAPAGLAGMRARERGLVRPLLPFSRATLLRYARRRQLRWWSDPENINPRHLRSWIRTVLLPLLAERLPDLPEKLAEVRRHARRDRRGWDEALRHWPGLEFRADGRRPGVSWAALSRLPVPLAGALAEALVRAAGGPAGPARIGRALTALRHAPSGARADLGQGWRFELSFGRLCVVGPIRLPPPEGLTLNSPEGQATWGPWRVTWSSEVAPARQPRDGRTAWFIPRTLALRAWRPGDRIAPLAGQGHRLAVRCFQDARVPRSERATWPMLEGEGGLAWIPGVCRSSLLLPAPGTPAVRVVVEPRA